MEASGTAPTGATRRVLLVDDHALLRDMLAERLARGGRFRVLDPVGDAEAALDAADRERPDIVLMDVDMPGLECFQAGKRLLERFPDLKLVFLSAYFHDHYIEQALAAGAVGYLTKSEPLETIEAALATVDEGGAYFSEEVAARLLLDGDRPRLATKGHTRVTTLSPRELETLRYIARGLSKKEMAETMGLSVKTVEKHCGNVMRKLDIHDRVELARFAIREGLAEA